MKGILFQPWKIKAIAANLDKEWQTRRVIKFHKPFENPSAWGVIYPDGGGNWIAWDKDQPGLAEFTKKAYPNGEGFKSHYHIGEIIYIKEWARILQGYSDWGVVYNDDSQKTIYPPNEWINIHAGEIEIFRTARTCPAWAARYFIKITQVEACRTKDITWTDCVDEGIKAFGKDGNVAGRGYWSWDGDLMFNTPQLAYFALYDSINGKGAHERNWDWKYSFVKVVSHTLPNLEKELKSE